MVVGRVEKEHPVIPIKPPLTSFKLAVDEMDERESVIEKKVCDYAKSLGFWVKKFQSPGNWAVPDRIFVSPRGALFFIEFKRKGKPTSVAQAREHSEMREFRLKVYVVDSFDDGKFILDQYIQ